MDDVIIKGAVVVKKMMVLLFQMIISNKAVLSTDEFTMYFLINEKTFILLKNKLVVVVELR